MSFAAMVDGLTPQMRDSFQRAIELGRWPDGRPVEQAQREMMMQALLLWQGKYDADHGEAYSIDAKGELKFLCDSEKERLEAAHNVFKINLN